MSRLIRFGGVALFLASTAGPLSSSRAQTPDKIDSLIIPAAQHVFDKPRSLTFIRNFPGDIRDYTRVTFRKKNAVKIGAMVLGTAVLVVADQDLTDGAYWLGDRLGLSHASHQKTYMNLSISIGGKRLELPIGGPDNVGTGIYFVGDGITHFSIAGTFLAYGLVKNDNRAKQTASQLTEAILTTGFAIQLLKHATGRESPFVATERGGRWDVFPDQVEYAHHTPHYDAWPSGHLATAMATVTVMASNYPDNRFIKPVGYTLMTLLSYQMLNNKVHWASDYPIALAIGDTFAKIAVTKGRRALKQPKTPEGTEEKMKTGLSSVQLSPSLSAAGPGVAVSMKF